MLNASDALHAHSRCKARLMALLKQENAGVSDYTAFGADPACTLERFIRENDGNPDCESENALLRAAHATLHSVIMELVRKRAAGQQIDFEVQFAPYSDFGAASSSLIFAIWRLENKIHSLSE